VLAKIGIQRLAADEFHDTADTIDVGAVSPALAGIEHERAARRPPSFRGRQPLDGARVAHGFGIPQPVAEAGGVGQQMAQRDRPRCRPKLRGSFGVETLEHLR